MRHGQGYLLAAVGVLLAAAAPGLGQQAGGEDYVPRSEYEKLEQKMNKLQKQVQQNRKRTSSKSVRKKVKQYLNTREQVTKAARQEGGGQGLQFLPTTEFKPGWERIREDGWMRPGRRHEMNALLARSGDLDVYMGFDAIGRIQALEQDNIGGAGLSGLGSIEPGFQTAFGNINFMADWMDGAVEVYFDIFIASRPHPDALQGNEGYMLIRELPSELGRSELGRAIFDNVNVKAGEFEIDFGDAHYRRSNNAVVQRNPLIGNYVIDPRATDIGMEFFSPEDAGPVQWLFGIGNGGGTGDFQNDRGYSLHGKLWGEPVEEVRTSASIYYVDHSGNPGGFPASGTSDNLFGSSRDGGPYAGVMGDGFAPGQVLPGAGQQVLATQGDITWTPAGPLELYGHVGYFQDSDLNANAAGTPRESWLYYAGEGKYNFTERFYAALRYSGAAALSLQSAANNARDVESDGLVHRVQVGGGYWIHETVLAKLEYVYQTADDFTAASTGVFPRGVNAANGPEFNGVVAEISFGF